MNKIEKLKINQVKPTNKNFKDLVERLKVKGVRDCLFIKHKPIDDFDEAFREIDIAYKQGVSTLIFKTDKGYIGVYRRDDRKIDIDKLKTKLKLKKLELAKQKEIEKEFGFEIGAVGVYHKNLKYVMDKRLIDGEYVYGGVGDKQYDIQIKPEDLKKISEAKLLDFTLAYRKERGRKRILTGDTPSGKLHLGHYVGTLENRVALQNEYDTFIILANIHAYANYYDKADMINQNVYDVFLDNLAVGIDPSISTIFLESGIPELYELYGFFLTMVKKSRAMRNPTVKDEIVYKKIDPSVAFIAYPILQAADILGFNAHLVPVGEDQLPIIEQVREIARDFNKAYGKTFVIPEAKIGRVARLVGTDGKMKMSKSKGNVILLSDDEKTLRKKVMSIYTDPNRIHADDPGEVKGNPVFIYHDTFNPNKDEVEDLKKRYKEGKVGDVEVKKKLFKVLNDVIGPIRDKRKYYEDRPKEAKEILIECTRRARIVVREVVETVRERVGINNLLEG